jgi:hypothetical protein
MLLLTSEGRTVRFEKGRTLQNLEFPRPVWPCSLIRELARVPPGLASWDILSRPFGTVPVAIATQDSRPGLLSAVPLGLGLAIGAGIEPKRVQLSPIRDHLGHVRASARTLHGRSTLLLLDVLVTE